MNTQHVFCEHCNDVKTFDAAGRLRCKACRNAAVQERRINERIAKRSSQIAAAQDGEAPIRSACSNCGGPRDQTYKKGDKTYYRCKPCRDESARIWHVSNRVTYRTPRATLHANQAGQTPAPDKKPKPLWQPAWAAQSRPEIVAAVRDYRKAAKSLGVGA